LFQISDAEETMGVIRTEPIQVLAEAYDVAVDIAFPKGKSFMQKLVGRREAEKRRKILRF